MAKKQRDGEPLFHFLDIDAAEVRHHSTALEDMLKRRCDGMIIRSVLTPDTVDEIVTRLEREATDMGKVTLSQFEHLDAAPYVLGDAIVTTAPDLADYFAAAARFRRECRMLFRGLVDFEACLEQIFSALSGGRPAVIPSGPDGSTYTPVTIRVLPEGQEIGIHAGNEFLRLPQAWHLKTLVDVSDQLSFFIPLTVPDSGGELVVYALEWDDVAIFVPASESGASEEVHGFSTEMITVAERFDRMVFTPGPGDMLLFDGGRYFHRVAPVGGACPRRTIGGFLGLSIDHEVVYYWS